ncbi:DinB family protein [Antribacter gilvus]|uniref:DinB family protein n=1 Tax=Antribacter gilvus TaxID=2304675 RepID=UPI0013DF3BF9|nr:DinB family protein [Antribacter gilvus]
MATTTWREVLAAQLDFYWEVHLWPRLEGLTDEEYLWEPVDGSWSLRPGPDGAPVLEHVAVEPPIPPVTTFAWRAAHVGRDVLGKRARAVFGHTEAPPDADMYDDRHWPEPLPLTAAGALAMLQQGYTEWRDGVAALDDEALLRPIGPVGGPYAEDTVAALVAHINREVMAHGAELCLLRDLYRAYRDRQDPLVAAALAGRADDVARALAGGATGRPSLVREVAGLQHWDVLRLLVENGHDPSQGSPSALHYAAAAGASDAVRVLLAHGADRTATDPEWGLPPSGWARFFGHHEVEQLLTEPVDN